MHSPNHPITSKITTAKAFFQGFYDSVNITLRHLKNFNVRPEIHAAALVKTADRVFTVNTMGMLIR